MKRIVFILIAVFTAGLFSVSEAPAVDIESTFHGQFRINSYYQDWSEETGLPDVDETVASRLRFRPTWDATIDDKVKLHIQLNIGHINSNLANARYDNSGSDPVVAIRHGYISAPIPDLEGWTLTAGLIPISDKFGDVLFSGDWDYNPLAFVLSGDVSNIKLRIAHANASEGGESSAVNDDIDHWIVDADTEMGLGASYYRVNIGSFDNSPLISVVPTLSSASENYLGVRYNGTFNQFDVGGWALYNWGTTEFNGGSLDVDNTGYALKGEVKTDLGKARVGVMALYSTGDDGSGSDSDAFITPASALGTTGYWGYTGMINVQGPTDTGIDAPLNIDGAVYWSGEGIATGITTVQANVALPLIEGKLDGYAAIGWFQANEVLAGQDDSIGTDLYAQVKYSFSEHMALEAGVDYAALGEGHPFNQGSGESRNVTLLFSRLQLEY